MKDQHKHIDDVFHEKVYDYSTPPPGNVWDDIEKSLAKSKKKKVAFLYFKIAAGFIFLAGMTALYTKYINNQNPGNTTSIIAKKTEIENERQNDNLVQKNTSHNQTSIPGNKSTSQQLTVNNNYSSSKKETDAVPAYVIGQSNEIYESTAIATSEKQKLNIISRVEPSIIYASESKINIKNSPVSNKPALPDSQDDLFDELIAQNDTKKNRDLVWSIGGQAGPQYTYRKITNTDQTAMNNNDFDNYDSPMLAYAGGLQIEVEPSRRLSVQSGVYYSKVGQNISSRYVNQPKNDYFPVESYASDQRAIEVVNSIGTFTFEKSNTNITSSNSKVNERISNTYYLDVSTTEEKADVLGRQYFEFIEIPLILRYKIVDQKIGVNIIGGVNTDILVNNYVGVSNSSNETIESKAGNLKTFNYSGTVGFGFEYPVSKKVMFSIEPFFKYYISPIDKKSVANAHPYMIGIMTGLNYSF